MKKRKPNNNALAFNGAGRVMHDATRLRESLEPASNLNVQFKADVNWELQLRDSRRPLLDTHRVIAVTTYGGTRALGHLQRLTVSQRTAGRFDCIAIACRA